MPDASNSELTWAWLRALVTVRHGGHRPEWQTSDYRWRRRRVSAAANNVRRRFDRAIGLWRQPSRSLSRPVDPTERADTRGPAGLGNEHPIESVLVWIVGAVVFSVRGTRFPPEDEGRKALPDRVATSFASPSRSPPGTPTSLGSCLTLSNPSFCVGSLGTRCGTGSGHHRRVVPALPVFG